MNFNLFNNYKIIISIGLLILISILQKFNKSKTVTITSIDTQSTNNVIIKLKVSFPTFSGSVWDYY